MGRGAPNLMFESKIHNWQANNEKMMILMFKFFLSFFLLFFFFWGGGSILNSIVVLDMFFIIIFFFFGGGGHCPPHTLGAGFTGCNKSLKFWVESSHLVSFKGSNLVESVESCTNFNGNESLNTARVTGNVPVCDSSLTRLQHWLGAMVYTRRHQSVSR